MSEPKFICTVLPNGVYQKNGETRLRFSVCTSTNHPNSDLDEDTAGYPQNRVEFYKEFCALSERLAGANVRVLTDIGNPGKNNFRLSNDAYFRDNCGCNDAD